MIGMQQPSSATRRSPTGLSTGGCDVAARHDDRYNPGSEFRHDIAGDDRHHRCGAHRCGVATDRVVKAGQTIRELIKATAKDDKEQQEATDRFATFFLLTALPDDGDSKLVASCNTVTTEFQKFERHRVAGAPANST